MREMVCKKNGRKKREREGAREESKEGKKKTKEQKTTRETVNTWIKRGTTTRHKGITDGEETGSQKWSECEKEKKNERGSTLCSVRDKGWRVTKAPVNAE